MDEQLSNWEDRLRRELDVSVRDVQAGGELLAAVRQGGRRRVRRRRALAALPAAVVVAGAGVVWAGAQRPPATVQPAVPTPASPEPTTTAPATPLDDDAATLAFYAAGYDYDDAVELGNLWNVDVYEAKADAGRMLDQGQELPVRP